MIKEELKTQAEHYVEECGTNLTVAKAMLKEAEEILRYISSGKSLTNCPLPMSGAEVSSRVNRCSAKVDVLIMLAYDEEKEIEDRKQNGTG